MAPSNKTKRLSIAYFIGSLSTGGAERHVSIVASELARRGHDVSIYCLRRGGILEAQTQKAGIKIIGPSFGSDKQQPNRLTRLFMLMLSVPWLFFHLLFRRPQIVHFFLPEAYLVGGILSLATASPHRLMSRRSLNIYQSKKPRLASLEHRLHSNMHALLGNSRKVAMQLLEENAPTSRVGLIYNGIEIERFTSISHQQASQTRSSLNLSDNELIFIIVANLIPYKGHSDLIEAFRTIKSELPQNWTLLIVGRDDGIQPNLERQAEEAGIHDHIRFTGLRQDIPDLLAASNIGILCSHEEGFSNALLESMAAGLPIVATDTGGNAEAVADGETGYIVPVKDPQNLGKALSKLANNITLATQMGKSGRERVETLFSLHNCVDKYELLYHTVLEGKEIASISGINLEQATSEINSH